MGCEFAGEQAATEVFNVLHQCTSKFIESCGTRVHASYNDEVCTDNDIRAIIDYGEKRGWVTHVDRVNGRIYHVVFHGGIYANVIRLTDARDWLQVPGS